MSTSSNKGKLKEDEMTTKQKRGPTPGPWSVIDSEREDAVAEQQVVASNGEYICDLIPILIGNHVEESEANAALIAAAPELLSALKFAVQQLEDVTHTSCGPKTELFLKNYQKKGKKNHKNNG